MWISLKLLLLFWPMWHLKTNFKILTGNEKIKNHFKDISLKYKININKLFDSYKNIQNITHFLAKFISSPEILLYSNLLQMKLLSTYFEYQFSFTIWVANSAKFLALCYKWGRKLVTHKPQRISHIGFLPESGTFQRSKVISCCYRVCSWLLASWHPGDVSIWKMVTFSQQVKKGFAVPAFRTAYP